MTAEAGRPDALGWRARLLQRMRIRERRYCHAVGENALAMRVAAGVELEELRGDEVGGQADVGHRRRVAVAELSGVGRRVQVGFDGVQRRKQGAV